MIEFDRVTYTYPYRPTPSVVDVSFRVRPGELKVLTGPSGCGKTTMLRLANGLAPHYWKGTLEGDVRVAGISNRERPASAVARDAGTLFQDPEEQFFALTVGDELAFAPSWAGVSAEEIRRRVRDAALRLGIADLLDQPIGVLSEGEKQAVGMASLLAQGVEAFILDEPSANLDPEATAAFGRLLGELKRAGAAILVVDHRLYWLRDLADEVLVVHAGRIVERGPFAMLDEPGFSERWGLRSARVADLRARGNATYDAATDPVPLLEVERLCAGKSPRGASDATSSRHEKPALVHNLSFKAGAAVTALIGRNGSGKTTVARALCGLESASGTIRVRGVEVEGEKLLERTGLVLQNADHQLQMRTVFDEVRSVVAAVTPPDRWSFFGSEHTEETERRIAARATELLDELSLGHLAERHPQSLSGGEKQRLVVACALARDPDVLILDEPTSGLDGANMLRIAGLLKRAAASGKAVLLVTNDLELLEHAADAVVRIPELRSHV